MINLLSPEHRAVLAREYQFRRLAVLLGALAAIATVAVVLLGTLFVLLIIEKTTLIAARDAARQTVQREDPSSLTARTRQTAVRVARIAEQGTHAPVMESVDVVIAKKIAGVSVTRLTMRGSDLEVQGIAKTRSDLLAFAEALRADSHFESVAVPTESLLKSSNVSFNIRMVRASQVPTTNNQLPTSTPQAQASSSPVTSIPATSSPTASSTP